MENDNILFLFEKKTDEDLFNFESEEYNKWEKERQMISEKLFDFIHQRVHPKSQEELNTLLDEYIEAVTESFYCENKYYYKQGFLDVLSIIKESLK